MRGGNLWTPPCVDTLGATDRARRGSPFALADATFILASEPGHRRAAEPSHIGLALRRTAAERIAAGRDPSIAGALAAS